MKEGNKIFESFNEYIKEQEEINEGLFATIADKIAALIKKYYKHPTVKKVLEVKPGWPELYSIWQEHGGEDFKMKKNDKDFDKFVAYGKPILDLKMKNTKYGGINDGGVRYNGA